MFEADLQDIHDSEEVIDLIQQLSESPKFKELKDAANERPEKLSDLLGFIHDEYPTLHDLFSNNPRFLMLVISGNMPTFEVDDDEDDGPDQGQEAESLSQSELTAQDRENIRSAT